MSIKFLSNDFEKVSYLLNLLTSHATGLSSEPHEFEILRNELLAKSELIDKFPTWLKTHHNLDSFWGFIKQKFATYAERRTYLSEEFTPILDFLEFGTPLKKPPLSQAPKNSMPVVNHSSPSVIRKKRKVFIVHGRDNEAKKVAATFIKEIGLEAIILHEQASSGMTIIEKIEHYSNDADFALVLYTPCDLGRDVHECNPPQKRARQNVIFEHGYLIAKLGRKNVCALVKEEIEIPNDISGVVYISMENPQEWKSEVVKELKACGYEAKAYF